MKYLRASRLLAAASILVSAGHAGADASGKWQSSQEVYNKVCGYCHEANVGPVITGRNLPTDYIGTIVRSGNRAMPAFRESEISNDVLAGVVQLVSTGKPGAKQ